MYTFNLGFLLRALLLEVVVLASIVGFEKPLTRFPRANDCAALIALIVSWLMVVTLALIFAILMERFGVEILAADPLALSALAVASIFLLFLLRCRNAIAYGSLEIVVGLVSVFISANAGQTSTIQAPVIYTLATKTIGLLGGMYIVIRGLDNWDRNLPSKWRKYWDVVFHGTPPSADRQSDGESH